MTRSGYSDECEHLELYRGSVHRAINGKRGQAFLRELARIMDETPEEHRVLITGELMDAAGDCCAIGLVCKSRGVDVSRVDEEDPRSVADAVGISTALAAEIEFLNDEDGDGWTMRDGKWSLIQETPQDRWNRMRRWVAEQLKGGE